MRRISLANAGASTSTFRQSTAYDRVRRVNGAFVAKPVMNAMDPVLLQISWLRIEPDGSQATLAAQSDKVVDVYDLVSFGSPRRIFHVGTDYGNHYVAAFGDDRTSKLTKGSPLFDVQANADFRYVEHGVAVSFDGERALVMHDVLSAYGPRLALIGADANRVGEMVQLPISSNCQTLRPTAHGGAYHSSDGGLHWVELGSAGDVVLDVRLSFEASDRLACPLVAATEQGFAAFTFVPFMGWSIIRVTSDGTQSTQVWDALTGTPSAIAVTGDSAIAIVEDSEGKRIAWLKNGKTQYFPIDGKGEQIPSEAGTLFMYWPATREIVEVRCSG
ncbi:MAG TPA: hypothetical protein VFQ35_09160 [Polyangiaceae bacterium]|nr:hypothetical protein [Polyangiaceae bacterium]